MAPSGAGPQRPPCRPPAFEKVQAQRDPTAEHFGQVSGSQEALPLEADSQTSGCNNWCHPLPSPVCVEWCATLQTDFTSREHQGARCQHIVTAIAGEESRG